MKQMMFVLFVLVIISCGGKDEAKVASATQGLGSVSINFKRLDERVTKTVIEVSGDDFENLVYEFSDFENNVMLYNIPAGENRTIDAKAFDEQNAQLYSGSVTGIMIVANQITLVKLVLTSVSNEEVTAGDLSLEIVTNNPPEIVSLTANPNPVFASLSVSLNLEFSDADDDDVTISWEAESGSLNDRAIANPVWTAREEAGDVNITVTLSDGKSQTSDTITITVKTDPNKLHLVINEILADPADDLLGDANNDGTRSSTADEFIEVVNNGETTVNLSGFSISDTDNIRHIFPEGTVLLSRQAIVIFGGGTPNLEGILTQTASTGALSLGNTSETVSLLDSSGALLDSHVYGSEGGDNQSITRSPDITGNFVKHTEVNPEALFSPGKTVELNNF